MHIVANLKEKEIKDTIVIVHSHLAVCSSVEIVNKKKK